MTISNHVGDSMEKENNQKTIPFSNNKTLPEFPAPPTNTDLSISFNNLKLAVIYGSAMASFTVEKFGTQKLVNYTPSMMATRIKAFKELTTFDIGLKQTITQYE